MRATLLESFWCPKLAVIFNTEKKNVRLLFPVATKIVKLLGTKFCKVEVQQFQYRPGDVLRVLGE
jgi:hypothetical protein